MRFKLPTLLLSIGVACGTGCDATDYYPQHEAPLRSSDLQKQGPGSFGGNNSVYPVGTPGTTGTDRTAPAPTTGGKTSQTTPINDSNVGLNATDSSGVSTGTGTYTGRSVGASTGSNAGTPVDGTTNMGTSAGH